MPPDNKYQPSGTAFDLTKYDCRYETGRLGILRAIMPPGQGKRAIDLGCGPGYFSCELATRGWETLSVDTDSKNIANAKKYAHDARQGDALSVLKELQEDHYDLVLALEIIEHMPKTHGMSLLAAIRRVLKPGGKLILSTPNRYSPEGLGGYYWGEKIRGWGKWTAYDPTHIHIYSSSEILGVLGAGGFAVEKITGYFYEGRLPLIGRWKLPLTKSTAFPLNRFGFNIILECRKK
jgi:2-polyprenyl-3-methyl-5-hydroxy-6-metoxy-1,4-benzoquinol methylase